jgi:hypothetical protein
MSKVKTIYAVCKSSRDGFTYPTWFFDDRDRADAYSCGKGFHGGKSEIRVLNAIEVDGKTYLLSQSEPVKMNFTEEDKQELIKAAKAKLTDEELKLLCLTR